MPTSEASQFKTDYARLAAAFRKGELRGFESTLPELKALAVHLSHYNQRDWKAYSDTSVMLQSSCYDRIRADFLFLEGNSWLLRSNYDQALSLYKNALAQLTPDCLLANEELVRFNRFVIRSLSRDFRFRIEIPELRKVRLSARKSDHPSVEALVINSYGEHYYLRGQFKRAFRLFLLATDYLDRDFKLNDYLHAASNVVRSALQTGELGEAERWLKRISQLVLKTGNAFLKDRYDLVYAEVLNAAERYDEALTHLDFTMGDAVPLEKVRMKLLQSRILLTLNRPSEDVLENLRTVQRFEQENQLGPDTLADFHTTFASAYMSEGDLTSSYRSLVRAEALSMDLHNPYLRAEVTVQKARLNRLLGKTESATRLLIEALHLSLRQNFALIVFQAIQQLAFPELLAHLDRHDRELIEEALLSPLLRQNLGPTSKAAKRLRPLIADTTTPNASPATTGNSNETAKAEIEISTSDSDEGIYLRQGQKRTLIVRSYRMTGKLLVELLRSPNRDLSLDHLHLQLWGGPIRNESHVQKLKTLVSRLRAELREKRVPIEIESREYATYRAVTQVSQLN